MTLTNPAGFYSAARKTVMGPRIEQNEVDGCNIILRFCEGLPISWAAYALATAWHETAHTMEPIAERGGNSYFTRLYDVQGKNPERARRMGNTVRGGGPRYRGRGFVQLTWKVNYERAAKVTGYPLAGNPDLAMRPDIAGQIMRHGMVEGWFTGKRFSSYLPASGKATRNSFIAARRIINGTDKAALIADYALQFQDALEAGGWQ